MDLPIIARTIENIIRDDHPSVEDSCVTQITSAPGIHENIYHGNSFCDPSGRYIIYLKATVAFGNVEVWRYDFQCGVNELIMTDVMRWAGIGMCCDQRHFFCARMKRPDIVHWMRLDIVNLTMESYEFQTPGPLSTNLCGISPDAQQIFALVVMPGHCYDVVCFDTLEGRTHVIFEGTDGSVYSNPILSRGGRYLCVQWNRGERWDETRRREIAPISEEGATYIVIDLSNGQRISVPAGRPHGLSIGGHHTWIGDYNRILYNVVLEGDAAQTSSLEMVCFDEQPRRTYVSDLQCVHPSVSWDGRFFVTDLQPDASLVVGSLKTGCFTTLCQTNASLGRPQYTHPHPWFTSDSRHVIFTSDQTGMAHVYAVSIPPNLLGDLER